MFHASAAVRPDTLAGGKAHRLCMNDRRDPAVHEAHRTR